MKNGKKYYSLYLDARKNADKFSVFLKKNHFYYERSGCGNGYYFCVLLYPEQASTVNDFLDTLP